MADEYDYFVNVQELGDPIGGVYKYVAKVPYIVENPGPNFKRVYPHLHEWWGKTEQEAEKKAKAEADGWIAKQQSSQ